MYSAGIVELREPLLDPRHEGFVFDRADRQVHGEAGGLRIPDRFAVLAEPGEQAFDHHRIERRAVLAARGLGDECRRHFVAMSVALGAREHFVAARAAARAQLDQLLREQREIGCALFDGERLERRQLRCRLDGRGVVRGLREHRARGRCR